MARRAAAAAEAPVATAPGPVPAGPLARLAARVRNGRPAVLTVRLVIVLTVGVGSAALVGSAPATPALITGAITWLLLTARDDLARPDDTPDRDSRGGPPGDPEPMGYRAP